RWGQFGVITRDFIWCVRLRPDGHLYWHEPGRVREGDVFWSPSLKSQSFWIDSWALALVLATPSILWSIFWSARALRRRRARRRMERGCCPKCGYDCRATPGECSECGERLPR